MIRGIAGKPFIDFDRFLDIEGLRALDGKICVGIAQSRKLLGFYGKHLLRPEGHYDFREAEEAFFRGDASPELKNQVEALDIEKRIWFFKAYSGAYTSMINVRLKLAENFFEKGRDTGKWTEDSRHFPELRAWIEKLPFQEVGRVLVFLLEHDCPLPIHYDRLPTCQPHKTEFITVRSNLKKPLYIYDEASREKHYIRSHSYFFNDCDWHGADPSPSLTWSVRIDGIFTPEFREQALGSQDLSY